jgi:nitronate monooxygenase
MPLRTKLTDSLAIRHPILLAPMSGSAGGRLAAAVSWAGGLGLIGGGARDAAWLEQEYALAGDARVGCGFITWVLAKQPHVLDLALARGPVAVMLAFGDPAPFAPAIHAAGSRLICMVHNMEHARAALDAGADIIVAQGTEAGGHGALRTTLTLVPEIADFLAGAAPDTLLVAAGGVADGRGLAAALMLGADGVLVGSRFWTSDECTAHPNLKQAVVTHCGDDTRRQITLDIAWDMHFPSEFTGRALCNTFLNRWRGREAEHRREADALRPAFLAAVANGDAEEAGINIGEVIGLMHGVRPAANIVADMVTEAEALLRHRAAALMA